MKFVGISPNSIELFRVYESVNTSSNFWISDEFRQKANNSDDFSQHYDGILLSIDSVEPFNAGVDAHAAHDHLRQRQLQHAYGALESRCARALPVL